HRGLGQADRLPYRRVRAPAVLLQLLDDLLGDVVEENARLAAPVTALGRRPGEPASRNPPQAAVTAPPTAGGQRRPWRMRHEIASSAWQSCHAHRRCQLIPQVLLSLATDSLVCRPLLIRPVRQRPGVVR